MNETEVAYKFFIYPLLSSMFYVASCKCLSSYKNEFNSLYKGHSSYRATIKFTGAFYNLAMTIYSGGTFFLLCRELLKDHGTVVDYTVWLENHLIDNNNILKLCWVFLHSKTVAYFDTYFVLLKGGTPIFLQEYHHFGAVWSWFLPLYVDSSAVIIPCLFNSFVHAIMYFYYFLSVFDSRKALTPVKPLITTLQLVQLCGGFYVCFTAYIMRHAGHLDFMFMSTVYFFHVYDVILILLFLQFSYNQYFKKKKG